MTINETHRNIIISTTHNRVEVDAYPGSGKTATLLAHWEYLRKVKNIPDKKILLLSFSNATVGVIKDRIKQSITNTKQSPAESSTTNLSNVTVQTVHGFACQLIYGSTGYVEILDDNDALLDIVIRSIIKDTKKGLLWVDTSPKIKKSRLKKLEDLLNPINLKLVSTLLEVKKASKQSLSTTLKISRFSKISTYLNVIIEVQRRFSKAKKKNGAMDFADMLVEAIKIIDEKPLSVPFTHILVDEYQDCSAAQTKLLAKLARLPKRSIMVFGDQYQSIFGFTGASYTPLSTDLNGVTTLSLPFSHRLTAETAALASAVAQLPKQRAIKTNHSGEMPVLVNNKSLTDQTKRVVEDIKLLIADGAKPQNIVVLARTKASLGYIEATLLAQNLLSDRRGLIRDSCHVIRVLKLIRIVERCIKNDERVKPEMLRISLPNMTDVTVTRWKQEASKLQKVLAIPSFDGRYKLCAATYVRLLGGVRKNPELHAEVNRFETFSRMHKNAAAMFHAVKEMDANCVVTSTIHAAKGQEWDHVLIVGVTDGLLPIYHAKDEQSLAEERNLLYVAITRARKTVRLYHAPTPHARSRRQFDELCQFINTPAVKRSLIIE